MRYIRLFLFWVAAIIATAGLAGPASSLCEFEMSVIELPIYPARIQVVDQNPRKLIDSVPDPSIQPSVTLRMPLNGDSNQQYRKPRNTDEAAILLIRTLSASDYARLIDIYHDIANEDAPQDAEMMNRLGDFSSFFSEAWDLDAFDPDSWHESSNEWHDPFLQLLDYSIRQGAALENVCKDK